jgi:hypothetical protein
MNVEIDRRVFFKTVTMVMLTIMAIAVLPMEGQAQRTTKIYGKAAIIMKSGDVMPVAKEKFVLLPFNLYAMNLKIREEAKKYAGYEPPKGQASDSWEILTQKAKERNGYYEKVESYCQERIMEEIQKAKDHGKYIEFRTDLDGSYEVVVPPGYWYICSQYNLRGGFATDVGNAMIIWAVPITINEGQVLKLDLDNDNASYIK